MARHNVDTQKRVSYDSQSITIDPKVLAEFDKAVAESKKKLPWTKEEVWLVQQYGAKLTRAKLRELLYKATGIQRTIVAVGAMIDRHRTT